MPQIRPITEVRNTVDLSSLCHTNREPIFITKDGHDDMVVMSMDTYQELLEGVMTDAAIEEAEAELRETGVLYDAREQLPLLRRRFFDSI